MKISDGLTRLFSETVILKHPDDYFIVSIDVAEWREANRLLGMLSPFSSVTLDVHEVSLVLKSAEWEMSRGRFNKAKEAGPYRLITFDIVLDLSVVGFLSVVSNLLAEAGISIYALSTYLRDHILVKKEEAAKAVEILQQTVDKCKTACSA